MPQYIIVSRQQGENYMWCAEHGGWRQFDIQQSSGRDSILMAEQYRNKQNAKRALKRMQQINTRLNSEPVLIANARIIDLRHAWRDENTLDYIYVTSTNLA